MYFSIFQSYNNDNIDNESIICVICLLSKDNLDATNELKMLSEFKNIIINCKCRPILHENCLHNWLKESQSCPICRQVVSSSDSKWLLRRCVNIVVRFFKCMCALSFLNMSFLIMYNVYFAVLDLNNNNKMNVIDIY